ncbi:Uncharacterized protein TCM_003932 [Theobroma cacao]|uniref:Uncharacterized protein n=1 Tax=Theobroma cacao TaxID=3641 RepID=A0A061DNF8_THECC|nr:Uncharacterized protein TCM_003932 [Theobroma cacao]
MVNSLFPHTFLLLRCNHFACKRLQGVKSEWNIFLEMLLGVIFIIHIKLNYVGGCVNFISFFCTMKG